MSKFLIPKNITIKLPFDKKLMSLQDIRFKNIPLKDVRLKDINLQDISLQDISFSEKMAVELPASTRLVDTLLKDTYLEHLSEQFGSNEEEIKALSEVNKIDPTFFIGEDQLHQEYIDKLNATIYRGEPKRYVRSFGELSEDYSLDFWDKLTVVNDAFSKNAIEQLEEDLQKKAPAFNLLYKEAKENLIIPLMDKYTNEKVVGLLTPNLNMNSFLYNKVIFISPETANLIFNIKNFDIFESTITGKSPNEFANALLIRMIEEGLSDLSYSVLNERYYKILGEKDAVSTVYTASMPIATGEAITEEFLMYMKKRKNTANYIRRKISFKYKHKDYTFRIAMMRQSKTKQLGIRRNRIVSIRLLADISKIKSFKNSGMYPEVIELIKMGLRINGMSLIVGETGSGKSTLLYRCLYDLWTERNSKITGGSASKLFTIDNPMEYEIDGADQIDLSDTASSDDPMLLQKTIDESLQHNPDIVSIGEMRSAEEIKAFVNYALRGHVTAGTLHAKNTKSGLKLLTEVGGVPPMMVVPIVSTIIHQSLPEKLCQSCFGENSDCIACKGIGSLGVIPILEIAVFKGLTENDIDVMYDYDALIKQGKLAYISKISYAKRALEDRFISQDTYDKIFHEHSSKVTPSMVSLTEIFKVHADV